MVLVTFVAIGAASPPPALSPPITIIGSVGHSQDAVQQTVKPIPVSIPALIKVATRAAFPFKSDKAVREDGSWGPRGLDPSVIPTGEKQGWFYLWGSLADCLGPCKGKLWPTGVIYHKT